MKLQILVALAAFAGLSAFATIPGDAIFNEVAIQAQGLGYVGSDVTVCLSSNRRIVAAGVSSWNSPLQIYLVNPSGLIVRTRRVSRSADGLNHRFDADGRSVSLGLGLSERTSYRWLTVFPDAVLVFGPTEIAQLVSCYRRTSGLE